MKFQPLDLFNCTKVCTRLPFSWNEGGFSFHFLLCNQFSHTNHQFEIRIDHVCTVPSVISLYHHAVEMSSMPV